jgi:hypothetical protein
MVKLRREMEGLDWDDTRTPPRYWADPALWESSESAIIDLVLQTDWGNYGHMLLVGPPLRLLTELTRREPRKVTVVEPVASRRELIVAFVAREGLQNQVTIHGKHYAEIGFERSSFDAAVLYDCLNRYALPRNVLRKAARELKMGCVLGIRVDVARTSSLLQSKRVAEAVARLPGVLRSRIPQRLSGPPPQGGWEVDLDELLVGVADQLRFGEPVAFSETFARVAETLTALPGWARAAGESRLGELASVVERLSPSRASTVWCVGTKDVGFGRVFQLGGEN